MVLITGKSGTGKTWIMKSLIQAAAERQYRCRYVKTRDLMEDIAIAVDDKGFSRLADQLDRIANGSHRLELKGPSMREKGEKVMK